MTNFFPDNLPKDYREFESVIKDGQYFSHRLAQPAIHIFRSETAYKGSLGAMIPSNGETQFHPARTNEHNWVIYNDKIRPLPFDAPYLLSKLFEQLDLDCLLYPEVLTLRRQSIEGFNVLFDENVFESANIVSAALPDSAVIEGLNADLYLYQKRGVAWLDEAVSRFGGAILADEMGLGKTLQIIALILKKKVHSGQPVLVTCPTSLIANWRREVHRFAPDLGVLIHRGSSRTGFYKDLIKADLVITTYDTVVNDIALFRGVDWSFLICDEAQALKNPLAKRRIAISSLFRRYTIPVTGTPVENSLTDLWSLADLTIPGLLGPLDEFQTIYPDSEESALQLSDITDNFILKRRVSEVAQDLPERTDIDVPIEMSEHSWSRYCQIREEAIEEYGQAGRLVAVGKLAMYCAHPWLSQLGSSDYWDENSRIVENRDTTLITPKLEYTLTLLKEAITYGKKVIIFAAYNSCYELIFRGAEKEHLTSCFWGLINGSTPAEERQNIVDAFSNEEGAAVLILNPKAAGAGLNITAATVVVHFTQNWNPALEMQASARAHRRGQNQPVTIYRLFYSGTVEETMIARSLWKREMGEAAVPIKVRDDGDLDSALNMLSKTGA